MSHYIAVLDRGQNPKGFPTLYNQSKICTTTRRTQSRHTIFGWTWLNRSFTRSGHMVRNKLCWDANNAAELSKQRKVGLDWYEFLCSTALVASQHNLFRTMWPDRAKGLLTADQVIWRGGSRWSPSARGVERETIPWDRFALRCPRTGLKGGPARRIRDYQAPVVQRLDNAIQRINHYPADSVVRFVNTYPLDSDLSSG